MELSASRQSCQETRIVIFATVYLDFIFLTPTPVDVHSSDSRGRNRTDFFYSELRRAPTQDRGGVPSHRKVLSQQPGVRLAANKHQTFIENTTSAKELSVRELRVVELFARTQLRTLAFESFSCSIVWPFFVEGTSSPRSHHLYSDFESLLSFLEE